MCCARIMTRLIVDEYQDCSVRQHALVAYAAQTLPTVVLGDPLQAIFGFGIDDLADWEMVTEYFPVIGQLNIALALDQCTGRTLGKMAA